MENNTTFILQIQELKTYFDSNHKILSKEYIPIFYKEIHLLFMKFFKNEPTNLNEILKQSLWLNENIKINSEYIYYKKWDEKGVNKIKHIINEFGIFMNNKQIYDKYKIKTNYLELLQIQKSLPKAWVKIIQETNITANNNVTDITIKINNKIKLLYSIKCNEFYWHIIKNLKHIPKNTLKWENTLNIVKDNSLNWEKLHYLPFKTIRETKIQSLQYRILHKTIQCNEWLQNLSIKQSNICELCNQDEIDTISHYFITCPTNMTFWISLIQWWHLISKNEEKLNDFQIISLILLGSPSITNKLQNKINNVYALDFLLFQAKYYIYIKKVTIIQNMIFILSYLS